MVEGIINVINWARDFPGGAVAKTPCLLKQGVQVRFLVRDLDPVCRN